jgi:uncharacterized protein (TIGR02391 family)
MAKDLRTAPRPRADISTSEIPSALRKLARRMAELRGITALEPDADRHGMSLIIANTVNATVDDVFGAGTADAKDFYVDKGWFTPSHAPTSWEEKCERFMRGRDRTIAIIQAAIDRLDEKLADGDEDASSRTLRAYEGLTLHPEIARAANDLYRDGHYAHAVEDSVKALNGFVRLRSGLDGIDGVPLMQKAFSLNNPVLKFNNLSDQSDRDEQLGFMNMFSGAVSGLRNPRAHGFIRDDPERALEFIAFVSLLAKLLEGARKDEPR